MKKLILKFVIWLLTPKEHSIEVVAPVGLDLEYPEEGGVMIKCPNEDYDYPGIPLAKNRDTMDACKAFLPIAINQAYRMLKRQKLVPLDPHYLSKSTREWYRMFSLMIDRDLPSHGDKWRPMREVFCFIWENDDAYRFRFQDILGEMKQDEMKLTDGDAYWLRKKYYNARGKGQNVSKINIPRSQRRKK